MYVIEQNGVAIIGPATWRRKDLQQAAGLRGNATPPPVPYDCGEGKTLRLVQKQVLAAYQVEGVGGLSGEVWLIPAVDMSTADAKTAARAALAARRYEAETGGILVNGIPFKTDRETALILTGARIAALEDPAFTVDWKVGNGVFVTLDATALIAAADAVRAHVQSCFSNEKTIDALIENAPDVETVRAISLSVGW